MPDIPGSTLTLDQAYQATYLWMFHAGEPPTEIVERGSHSVELRSDNLAAFVRVPNRPVNQRTVLAVLALEPPERMRAIFSAAGFTAAAVSIAEAQGIALFTLDADGRARPENGSASTLVPAAEPPAPFAEPLDLNDDSTAAANWGRSDFSTDEWLDCSRCGTNQHHSLDACRTCGASMSDGSSLGAPPDGLVYRCRECGSHDIEVVATNDPARRA